MKQHIHFCETCRLFTLHLNCPKCERSTGFFKPPKFSLQDKWEALKRKAAEPGRKKRGLL